MGGGHNGGFGGNTKGAKTDTYKSIIDSLPSNPDILTKSGWTEITDERAKMNGTSRRFKNNDTGYIVEFHKKTIGAPGFRGKDHYHFINPEAKSNKDIFLDKNANPVAKHSKPSHIIPKRNS